MYHNVINSINSSPPIIIYKPLGDSVQQFRDLPVLLKLKFQTSAKGPWIGKHSAYKSPPKHINLMLRYFYLLCMVCGCGPKFGIV